MRGPVMRRHVAVFGFDEHVAIVIDENRAEGMIAMAERAAGDFERPAQKMLVEFGRTHRRNAVHDRSCRLSIMQTAGVTSKPADQWPAMCRPISVRSASLARAS